MNQIFPFAGQTQQAATTPLNEQNLIDILEKKILKVH